MTQSAMRDLLARWAEAEPERCLLERTENLIQGGPVLEECYVIDAEKLWKVVFDDVIGITLDDSKLMRIQWAVQQAIVARGWFFELKYNPDCPDPRNPYEATVDSNKSGGWGLGNDGFVAPLLDAYLHTLEGENKLTNKKAG